MDYLIDSLGEICPVPIIMLERKIKEVKKDDRIILETDHSCSTSNVVEHVANKYGYPTEVTMISEGIWQIIITKNT
jgi:TusA-related sulfurtransferase